MYITKMFTFSIIRIQPTNYFVDKNIIYRKNNQHKMIIHKKWTISKSILIERGQMDIFLSIMVLGHSLNWIPEITTQIKYHKSHDIFLVCKNVIVHTKLPCPRHWNNENAVNYYILDNFECIEIYVFFVVVTKYIIHGGDCCITCWSF